MNRRGFSMIEIMLVLGLVPVIAFSVVYLNQQITKTSGFTKGKLGILETHQQLQLQLANKSICDSNFSSKVFSNSGVINFSEILDRNGKKMTFIGQTTEGLQLTSIQLRPDPGVWNSYLASRASITSAGFALKTSLILGFKRNKEAIGASDTAISLPVPMIVGANLNIISCAGVDTNSLDRILSDSCAQVGGTYNPTLGTCVLNSVCNSLDKTKPVSQKCLDQQIGTLRTQVTQLLSQVKASPPPPTTGENPSIKECIETASVTNNALRMPSQDQFLCSLKGGYTMTFDQRGFIWDKAQKGSKVISDPTTLALIKTRITELYNARIASGK